MTVLRSHLLKQRKPWTLQVAWIASNKELASAFSNNVIELLLGCFKPGKSLQVQKVKMWGEYHRIRNKLEKCKHPLKDKMIFLMFEMCGDDSDDDSWCNIIDRGGSEQQKL